MRRCTAPTLVFVVLVLLSGHAAAQAALTGGCAKVNITPPLGLKLIGSKGQPSDAVLDELFAKALILSDGTTTLALVSIDLLYTPLEEITDPVRALVKERTGIPEQNVMVCASHTHSGPEVFTNWKLDPEDHVEESEIDQAYLQTLIREMAGAVELAHRKQRDVRLGAALGGLPEVIYNRRPRYADGKVQMAFTLPPEIATTHRVETGPDGSTRVTFTLPEDAPARTFGPIDPDVLALRVEDSEGDILASLVGFGCHPVCVYPFQSTAVSADFPARATRVVEQGEGGVCLFALGLAGNIVPRQRDVGPCAEIGKALGGEALRRLQFVTTSDKVALSAGRRSVTLVTKNGKPESITTEIQALRLGEIYLLGLPGEVLVEVGLAIKSRADLETLFITTMTNDSIGYVCHREAYNEGAYEPGAGTNLAPGAGEIIIEQSLALLDEMRQARAK